MAHDRFYQWYIDPLGCPNTNKLLAEHPSENEECPAKLCNDGVERDLWRCEGPLIRKLEKARVALELKYKVYVQDNLHGKPRPWKIAKKMRPGGERYGWFSKFEVTA